MPGFRIIHTFTFRMKLRSKITLAMLVLVALSLLIIGAVSFFSFKRQNETYHAERLERKERAIKTEMLYFTREVPMDSSMQVIARDFEEKINQLADIHNLTINVFNMKGEMVLSSIGNLSDSIFQSRVPLNAMLLLQDSDRVVIPTISNGKPYLSDYTVIRNYHGERIAILNLPYLRTNDLNRKELKQFLTTLGTWYLFLFVGALLLTIWLSNSITKPLTMVSNQMKTIDLAKRNKPLEWRTGDELGAFIEVYNSMLAKLEESRDKLAQSERESAWREMARQVAHEIKNPLTPMKLSIQHLQRMASESADPEWRARIEKSAATLIEQIDALSTIATEFANFAQMPKARRENITVGPVLKNVVRLFKDYPFEINLHVHSDAVVFMDKNQLTRCFTNIMKNAAQALEDAESGKITVTMKEHGPHLTVEISDNGPGIDESIRHRIFQPNFTTKTSGTGLGLAMVRSMLTQAGGDISFSSTTGEGTTFKIVLPTVTGNAIA